MKINELINKLKEFDPNEEVLIGFPDEEYDIETVEFINENRKPITDRTITRCCWVRISP